MASSVARLASAPAATRARHAAYVRGQDAPSMVRGGRGRGQEDPRAHDVPRARPRDFDVLVFSAVPELMAITGRRFAAFAGEGDQ